MQALLHRLDSQNQRVRPDQPSTRGRLIGGHVLGRKIKGKIKGKAGEKIKGFGRINLPRVEG
jgi:hypothetical protein